MQTTCLDSALSQLAALLLLYDRTYQIQSMLFTD